VHARQRQLLGQPLPHRRLVALRGVHQPARLGERRRLLEEAAHHPAQLLLLLAEAETHGGIVARTGRAARGGAPDRSTIVGRSHYSSGP
jgi:hypothetical protein